jgi:hypothetical protein
MTHRELVTVPREFHPHKTQFFYLFIKTLTCHQKYICDRLLNTNETLTRETPTEERTRPFPASAGSVAGIDAPSRTKYLVAELRFANVVPLSGY